MIRCAAPLIVFALLSVALHAAVWTAGRDAGSDPLVDAGVVPELPDEPELQGGASPSPETSSPRP